MLVRKKTSASSSITDIGRRFLSGSNVAVCCRPNVQLSPLQTEGWILYNGVYP